MADIKMNTFALATDSAYIYGEATDGSQVKVKKGDFLSSLFINRGFFEGNANELKIPGMYYVTGNTTNVPLGCSGLMLVFNCSAATAQIVYNVFNGLFYRRALLYNAGKWDTWSEWM